MTPDLVAYIPVLNGRHLDWFKKHSDSGLYLISQEMAGSLLPRLARNMAAVPTEVQLQQIANLSRSRGVEWVKIFDPDHLNPPLHGPIRQSQFILPNEDISEAVVEKYFGQEPSAQFEDIWSRWDMTAVKRQSPVMADVEVSSAQTDRLRMEMARRIAPRSPDWWRQIGAVIYRGEELLACACNEHMPDEYTTYIFGDPRLNVDAGQKGKYCSIHAELSVICMCASDGLRIRGASLYCTVFPCEGCARAIVKAGISEVYFEEGYSALDAQDVLRRGGVRMIQIVKDPGSA